MDPAIRAALGDLGEKRIAVMDDAEISVQVLSAVSPGADLLDGHAGIAFASATHDALAEALKQHPSRYAGFARLPMCSPDAAADRILFSVDYPFSEPREGRDS